jgi:hypothetical protein
LVTNYLVVLVNGSPELRVMPDISTDKLYHRLGYM